MDLSYQTSSTLKTRGNPTLGRRGPGPKDDLVRFTLRHLFNLPQNYPIGQQEPAYANAHMEQAAAKCVVTQPPSLGIQTTAFGARPSVSKGLGTWPTSKERPYL